MSEREIDMNDGIAGNSFHIAETPSHIVAAEKFACFGDPSRIRIFCLLCHREESVTNIALITDMTAPAVSHHLKALRDAGLVTCRRSGKEALYHIADTDECQLFHRTIEQLLDIVCPDQSSIDAALSRKCACTEEQTAAIRQVHDRAVEHLDRRVSIEQLAREHLMSPTALKYLFREVYGESIAAHITAHRMEEAERLLRESDLPVSDIASNVGYSSPSKFGEAFKKAYGFLPSEYRKMHRGV